MPGSKYQLAGWGVGSECLAIAGSGVLLHRAGGFPGCLAPKIDYLVLQVPHRGQEPVDGSLGWGPRLALGRPCQVLQGEGLPHKPGGPALQATP